MKKTLSTSRSRLSSSLRCVFALVACLLVASALTAQELSPILTIDQDRLFSETNIGSDTMAALEDEAQALADENQRIEAELTAEERALTDKRADMTPKDFRVLADAFDAKVQQFRAEQDEKARQLNRSRDEARSLFFRDVAAVISTIVREKGALVVIDRREVFLSADSIDITDEAIRRINESK